MAGPGVRERFDERAGFTAGQLPAAAANLESAAIEQPGAAVPAAASSGRLALVAAPVTVRRFRSAIRDALATELERGTPFLFVPVFLAAGAFVYFAADSEPAFV